MKTTKDERMLAEQVSLAVDRLVRDPGADLELPDSAAAEALAAARQMAQLPALLGPVDPAFERRVLREVRQARESRRRAPWLKLGWAVAGLLAVLLAVLFLTPFGQTAVAGLMAVFDLGSTDVRIAPEYTPSAVPATAADGGPGVQQELTLEEAQELVSFAIPQPGYLPLGFALERVRSYTYPNLSAWIPQPFFVELIYGDGGGEELLLRVYSIVLGDQGSISSLNLTAPPIEQADAVDVNGRPGVLLRQDLGRSGAVLHEVVWEQDDLILALSSLHLDEPELLRIARSIRGEAP
jgi:hypothetical protein